MSHTLRHRLRPGGLEITVRVVRSAKRKRTIALQLAPDGRVTLRAPLGTKSAKLKDVLRVKAAWLELRLSGAWGEIPPRYPPREFVAGETFHFLGRQHRLRIRPGAVEDRVRLEGEYLHITSRKKKLPDRTELRARLKTWFVAQAKEFLPGRVARWTARMMMPKRPRVLITDQSRRWASCGQGAVLRFNWRLIGAPVTLVDYVIVHELCHLQHRNHSPVFWRELRRVMPEYRQAELQLLKIGPQLSF